MFVRILGYSLVVQVGFLEVGFFVELDVLVQVFAEVFAAEVVVVSSFVVVGVVGGFEGDLAVDDFAEVEVVEVEVAEVSQTMNF